MTPSPPIVQFDNVSFSYEKDCILQDVSIKICDKEFIGIFGPNGGGKTTFLKLLMGFLKPTKGKISLYQADPKNHQNQIGYVPQIARLDRQFPITTLELVLMGALSSCTLLGRYPPHMKEKALHLLEKVDLIEKRNSPYGTLSGGQAQRALIARALLGDPKLLLLDEPTASVDPLREEEILKILLDLKGKITIIMVTHDLQTILQKVERFLCIHKHIHSFLPSEVCEHFALGLYHTPISFGRS